MTHADGFETTGTDVRRWVGRWPDSTVRLLKLHGSIDWWRYNFVDQGWSGSVAARFVGDDPQHPKCPQVIGGPLDPRPRFLVGTFDKILSYETSLFLDQHLRFRIDLRDANRLIVTGYGFADKAINSRLIGWLARARDNRMVVCHPDENGLLERSRKAIRTCWNRWRESGQLVILPTYVEGLKYSDIAAHLA